MYYRTSSQSQLISAGHSDSISFEPGWQAFSGLSAWSSPFSQPEFLQIQQYGDALAPKGLMPVTNGYLDVGALFDSDKDSPTWTAADQTIMSQALDATHENSPRLQTQFGASSELDLGLEGPWHHEHHRHHHPHSPWGLPPPAVPEPSTLPMVGGGLLMLVGLLQHRLLGRRAY